MSLGPMASVPWRPALSFALFCVLLAPVAQSQVPALPVLVPEQEHVTLWEDGLVVQWAVVGRQYTDTDLPYVAWTGNVGSQVTLAELVGVVAPAASSVSGGGMPVPTYVYAAKIPVAPGETITYRAGSDDQGTTVQHTVTRPGGAEATLHFAALGDIGVDATGPDGSCTADVDNDPPGISQDCPAHAIRDRIIAAGPDLVVIPGDLAYSNSRQGWDSFMRFMTPLQSQVPVMAVAGNHEYHASLGYAQFLSEYVLPGDEHRYTFKAGPVTFVGINSDAICGDHAIPNGPPQDVCAGGYLSSDYTEWVRQALEDAANDETPWTVFFMHHPPYSYGLHGNHEGLQILYQDWIEEYGVDVVLTSHDHLYSRSFPMIGGQATRNGTTYEQGDGPIYLVTGGGGRGLYEQRGDRPDWLAAGQSVHHFTEFHASPERINVTATRIDGTLLDAFTIEARPLLDGDVAGRTSPIALVWAVLGLLVIVRRRD